MKDIGFYDLLVIGGGVNGAGAARDAAGRGLKVALCEKGDLGEGTSSRSGKLIHGGLRYLEYYEFRLVREALIEREVLLRNAPHIVWPMRFVLPHSPEQRPAWLIRLGLFLYDNLGGREKLASTRMLRLHQAPEGECIKQDYRIAFEYSDCWVDDARLVVLNALDAKERGASVLTRTSFVGAERKEDHWQVELQNTITGEKYQLTSKAILNTAGPWVRDVIQNVQQLETKRNIRLVKGSHIVLKKFWEGNQAYLLQNDDKRVIFCNPYEGDLCLIGTTDIPYDGRSEDVAIDQSEIDYLLRVINRYFKKQLQPQDVVHSFSGVRPLYDDDAENPSAVTRDYVFELDAPNQQLPVLSLFGGKITAFRQISEHALEKLKPFFPQMKPAWTDASPLPGGDLPRADFYSFQLELQKKFPWMDSALAKHYGRLYGTRCLDFLEGMKGAQDLGIHFGGQFYEREAQHLIEIEWAQTTEDILSRRTKHGLHLSKTEQDHFSEWLNKTKLKS
ncbi:MAG: glycerol-3-phosphate dehydrogenase [Deltaproteobacteria bacterium]